MTLKKVLPRVTVLSIFAALFCVPSYAAEDEKFDIVGLKLGMTDAQVKKALVDYGIPASDIKETRQFYGYSDGIKSDYRTQEFLSGIGASKSLQADHNESFRILFSPPPEGGRVVAIARNIKNQTNPPTIEQYGKDLQEKYGPTISHRLTNINQWMFGQGSMNCLDSSQSGEFGLPLNTGGILEKVFHAEGSRILTDRFRNGRVKDLNECANMLQYELPRYVSLATSVTATMIDVQSWVKAQLAANAMVESLRQEAIKKREGRGTKPVL